jgi:hypothetical protein
MSYNLFLDDIRDPRDAYIYPRRDENKIILDSKRLLCMSNIPESDWVVVRSYNEFIDIVRERGLPDVVSFDHDLHVEHIEHYFKVTVPTGIIEYDNLKHKTGKHCAEFLIDKWNKSTKINTPVTYIHSANIYGAEEIKKVLAKLTQ